MVVSEGLRHKDGSYIADNGIVDGFGHKVLGGVSQYLSNLVTSNLGIKSRNEKPGRLGRCSTALISTMCFMLPINVGLIGSGSGFFIL